MLLLSTTFLLINSFFFLTILSTTATTITYANSCSNALRDKHPTGSLVWAMSCTTIWTSHNDVWMTSLWYILQNSQLKGIFSYLICSLPNLDCSSLWLMFDRSSTVILTGQNRIVGKDILNINSDEFQCNSEDWGLRNLDIQVNIWSVDIHRSTA